MKVEIKYDSEDQCLHFSFSNDKLIISTETLSDLCKFFEMDIDPTISVRYTEVLLSKIF